MLYTCISFRSIDRSYNLHCPVRRLLGLFLAYRLDFLHILSCGLCTPHRKGQRIAFNSLFKKSFDLLRSLASDINPVDNRSVNKTVRINMNKNQVNHKQKAADNPCEQLPSLFFVHPLDFICIFFYFFVFKWAFNISERVLNTLKEFCHTHKECLFWFWFFRPLFCHFHTSVSS